MTSYRRLWNLTIWAQRFAIMEILHSHSNNTAARSPFNTLRPRQNGHHFADDIFKCIFLKEDVWTALKISLKFVPKVRINNIPALVQIMTWRRPGHKPLAEPMMISLLTHICVTRPQWVKTLRSQPNLSNPFSWKWICVVQLNFHWGLPLGVWLTSHHQFR